MPRVGPIKRRELIGYLKQLGFDGPYSGGIMRKDGPPLILPNPHESDISIGLLARRRLQAGITREEWEQL